MYGQLYKVFNNVICKCLGIMVEFTQSSFSAMENALFLDVELQLTGGTSSTPFDVTVTPSEQSPISAEGNIVCIIMCWLKSVWLTGDVDFNTAPLTATFASGMTTSSVSVPVIIDNIVEMDEEYVITLNQPTVRGVTLGTITMATGIIMDATGEWLLMTFHW